MKTSRCATIAVVLLAGGVWRLDAQTTVDLTRQGKLGTGATVPSQCAVGQVFFKTGAPAGANLYSCTSANVWSVVGLIPLGGDASGTAPATTVTGLQGRPVSAANPSDQDALRWNAASGLWAPEAVISVGSATPPATCSAGGLYLRNDPANNFHQLYVCSTTNVWTMASVQAGAASGRPANCLLGQTWLATDTGAMTYCSATGSPGTWSATLAGPAGPQGPAGANGNTIWNGTATPSGATGANGDFYLINPTTAPCLYGPKSSGNWPGSCVSLAGPAGAAGASGNTLLSGIGAPSNSTGANGDFYVRLDTSCLYGPKASGAWPGSCTSLIGPQGATGAAGAIGPQGPAGGLGGANGQIPYNNNGTAAGSNLSQNTDGSLSANKAFNPPLCTVTLSAAPAFDASQCNAFSLTLGSTTVTSSTLLNAKAGQSLTFTIVQDATGGRSFVWPTNLLSVCPVNPAAHTSTAVTAVFDGTNANAIGCATSDLATLIAGPTRSAPATPAAGLACWFDSSANTLLCKDPGGNLYAATKTVSARTANQFVTYIGADGVQQTAAIAAADVPAALSSSTSVNGTTIPASQTLLYSGGALGTPGSGTLTNASGLPLSTGVTGTLPVANGGTGTGSTLTGLVRGNSSAMTAAELSGDATTSGSNAVTIAGLKGAALPMLAAGNLRYNGSAWTFDPTAYAPVASPTFTGTTTIPSITLSGITGPTQCLHANSSGVVSGTGSDCGTGSGGASAVGYYWVGQSTSAPANAVNLGALSTGLLKISISAGVATPSTAVGGTDYLAPFGGQTANYFYAAPNGSAGSPGFRALVLADLPTGYQYGNLGSVPSTFAPSAHNLLSSAHADTTAASAVRGDGIFAIGSTPTWQRLAHPSASGGYFKWNGTDTVASTGAAAGTGSCTNQAVTAANADASPTCSTITSSYVDTSIAKTGADINTSNQVTVTHLASALPIAQGGTGQTAVPGSSGNYIYNNAGAIGAKAIAAGDVPTLNQSTTGNAATATALASAPSTCSAGQGATGINASGAAQGCTTYTQTIASGTASLGTGSIPSASCATIITVSATGAASTDSIIWNPNASIKAVTGYTPSTSGGLSIAAYPTGGYVNFDVCNWTSGAIAPGAVTLNWRVVR